MRFAKLTKQIASAMIVESDLINICTQLSYRLHTCNMANHHIRIGKLELTFIALSSSKISVVLVGTCFQTYKT